MPRPSIVEKYVAFKNSIKERENAYKENKKKFEKDYAPIIKDINVLQNKLKKSLGHASKTLARNRSSKPYYSTQRFI